MKIARLVAYFFIILLFLFPIIGVRLAKASNFVSDSLSNDSVHTDYVVLSDTIIVNDSINEEDKDPLDAIVEYQAQDSLVMTKDNWGYLYGKAEIDYTSIKLTGEIVSINMDSTLVEARYGIDSIGEEFGYPIFTDNGTDYESKTMKYNFKSKKGYSHNLVTEQGEGYVVADIARKNEDESFFIKDGRYTTCDEHECPHFYLALTKGKVKPGKDIVIGPSYLVVEGLKLPFIGLPFGFFPFKDKYSSGVIMPSYGDDMDRGFNLNDGGYYFALNDYMDLKVLGTIFTKGSWGLSAQSTYKKRYKYSGNVSIAYQYTKYEDKGLPDHSVSKDFRVQWSHSQDAKANMFRTFSANVNFTTQSYDRNNLNEAYKQTSTSNTKSSNVAFSQKFPDSPWSITGAFNINQTTSNQAMNITLPDLTVGMTRIFPFKKEDAVGEQKWYEKIQFSYTGNIKNRVSTTENDPSLALRNWNYAVNHSLPISATFTAFNYLNITPSIQYTERWYTKQNHYTFNNGTFTTLKEYDNKFKRVYDFSTSLSFQTKLYGFYTPLMFKKSTIRHVFTPSVSFAYAPDFSNPMWGYYETVYGYNPSSGEVEEYKYFPYQTQSQLFGSPSSQGTGSISFNFQNNVEMKYESASDSTGYKKISLIDNLGISFSYNAQAEQYKWSDISANLRLKLSKSLTFNMNATFDPYMYGFLYPQQNNLPVEQRTFGRLNKLRIDNGKGIARLKSTSYSISPSINQDSFAKLLDQLFGRAEDSNAKGDRNGDEAGDNVDETEKKSKRLLGGHNHDDDSEYDSDGYLLNKILWNFGFNFTMSYGYTNEIDYDKMEYKTKFSVNNAIGFNGSVQPTKNWSMSFYGNYNFDQKTLTNLSLSINRNLHCWSISANVQPIGTYKTYYVSIRANSSMLQDLKQEFKGRSTSYDPIW